MTLRTVTTPYDRLTLTEWRNSIAAWIGVDYASLNTNAQSELDRYIDVAHEFISQKFAHSPDGMRTWTGIAVSTTDGTLTLDKDVRHVMTFLEKDSEGNIVPTKVTTKFDYYQVMNRFSTDPYDDQTNPRYFMDGWNDTDPPQQQWRRVPTPTVAPTLEMLGRCYYGAQASEAFVQFPPAFEQATKHHLRMLWAAFTKDTNVLATEKAMRDDAIIAAEMADGRHGNAELSVVSGPPAEFEDEIG